MNQRFTNEQIEPRDALVKSARTDREAFGALFDYFYPLVFAYCVRRLVVRAVAEDVASEVFFKVAREIRNFRGQSIEEFRRWLFRISTNEINAHLRHSKSRRELLEAAVLMGRINAEIIAPITGNASMLDWSDLYGALEQLSVREQSIISLRFFGNLQHHQIATILNLKEGAIRVALSRSLDRLRQILKDRRDGLNENLYQ